VISSFEKLFEYSQEIPIWLISYNDRSYPSVEELSKIISQYRDVTIEVKAYHNGRGGKGSVAGSHEVLFVCKPKKKHFVMKQQEEVLNERF
jgi:adenine-specific DNA methylase